MGDIAESLINGEFDEWTGEYIGPAVGYPRSRDPEHYSNRKWRAPTDKNSPTYGSNPLGGVEKWLKVNGISRTGRCIWRYSTEVLNNSYDVTDTTKKKEAAIQIQEQWDTFTKWVKETYK